MQIVGFLIFCLLLLAYLAFSADPWLRHLRRVAATPARKVTLAATLALPYAIVALAQGRPLSTVAGDTGIWLLYLVLPALAVAYRPPTARPLHPLDIFVILAIWFPVEFDWLPGIDAQIGGTSLPLAPLLLVVNFGFLAFLVLRPLPGIGFSWRITAADLRTVVLALVAYMLFALPVGILTDFLVLGFAGFDLGAWLLAFVLGYLAVALPEELLFRGAIQNQLTRRLGDARLGLFIAAVIFGLSHLNNGTLNHGPPNWHYALMATGAGLAYGWAWQRSGKITVSALVHATVNFVWSLWLQGGS